MAGRRAVLIVEDDRDIRESIKMVLDSEGYQTFEASNGRDAIEVLRRTPRPCLILLDLMMPVMNGWEFLQHRRADDTLVTIPVVVVTAAGEPGTSVSAATAVIKKPIDLDRLLAWVKRYCSTVE